MNAQLVPTQNAASIYTHPAKTRKAPINLSLPTWRVIWGREALLEDRLAAAAAYIP